MVLYVAACIGICILHMYELRKHEGLQRVGLAVPRFFKIFTVQPSTTKTSTLTSIDEIKSGSRDGVFVLQALKRHQGNLGTQ